jgi:hypothetical protein
MADRPRALARTQRANGSGGVGDLGEPAAVTAGAFALAQTVIATSLYLLAHRSLAVHPGRGLLFRTVLWLTTGQDRRECVAVHRKHHAFTDRPGDLHSPRLRGFWRVQFLNAYYYLREARNPETIRRFVSDIREDRLAASNHRQPGDGAAGASSPSLWQMGGCACRLVRPVG